MYFYFLITESHTWLELFNFDCCSVIKTPSSAAFHIPPVLVLLLPVVTPLESFLWLSSFLPEAVKAGCRKDHPLVSLSSVRSLSLGLLSQPPEPSLDPHLPVWGLPPVSCGDRNRRLSTWNVTTFQFSALPNLVLSKPFPSRWMVAPFWECLVREPLKSFFTNPSIFCLTDSSITFSGALIQSPRSSQSSPPVHVPPWSESFRPGPSLHSLQMGCFSPLLDECFLIKGAGWVFKKKYQLLYWFDCIGS